MDAYHQEDLERDVAEQFNITLKQANAINNFMIAKKIEKLKAGVKVVETGLVTLIPYTKKGGSKLMGLTGKIVEFVEKKWAKAKISRTLLDSWN